MAGEGESSVSVGAGEESGALSPKNKVKFLCSHGGKVLPRPSDGLLKYVGGESRIVSVPRTVTFSEVMKKLGAMIEGGENMVLKYQLVPEDLDTLVSVRNEEDLKHMIEERDRHESRGAPLLRAFLFPSKPLVVENPVSEPSYALEQQRYIDAINGILRSSPRARLSPIRGLCTSSSACSSPKSSSPDAHTHTADLLPEPSPFPARHPIMHRVRSSPSITSLSKLHCLTTAIQHHDHHGHYHNQSQSQSHHQHPPPPLAAYATSPSSSRTLSQDPQLGGEGGFGMGRSQPMMSLAKTDMSSSNRGSNNSNNNNGLNYYYSTSRAPKGFAYYDDSATYGNVLSERVNSMPQSQSPRMSIWE